MSHYLSEDLLKRLEQIRLLLLDVDGVLTDGQIIIDNDGRETKHFDVKDGHWLSMLMNQGMEVIILTGRVSKVVEHRALELGIKEVHQGARDKVQIYQEIASRKQLVPSQVAFVGDDVVDIPLLRRVGFAAAVADATEPVKASVHYVTKHNGGKGAVREICELLLRAQGKWPNIASRYEFTVNDED